MSGPLRERAARCRSVACVAALLGLATLAAAAEPECARVIAVGDLHGNYDAFVSILQETGLVGDGASGAGEPDWSGDAACFVQLGDVVDRGPASRRILDLLLRLEEQAPGRVYLLLGNHEVMNLTGDLRSIDDGELAAFADDEDPAEREAAFRAFAPSADAAGDDALARREFDWRYPRGWFAHRRAFARDGAYGMWLSRHDAAVILSDTLFVHGGITLEDARRGVAALNREVREALATVAEQRGRLLDAGWLRDTDSLAELEAELAARLRTARRESRETRAARKLMDAVSGVLMREDGPLWNRELALGEEQALQPAVDSILQVLGVRRIVVGHTPTADHSIHARFGAQVFVIDTGAAPVYGGRISALEIRPGGTVHAIYLGESRVLAGGAAAAGAAAPSAR